ncbi:MAG: AAA family ATPase [Bacteroidales bacterium]|nr:AAA family ATPase [Bacteroidales bacterium]
MLNLNEYSEVELSVIGAIICDPEYSRQYVTMLKPEYFYTDTHRAIFQAILVLYESGVNPDIVTVNDYLRQSGVNNALGPMISSVEDVIPRENNIPTPVFIKQHVRLLIQHSIRRMNHEMGLKLQNNPADAELIKSEYERDIKDAQQIVSDRSNNIPTIGHELCEKYLEILDGNIQAVERVKTDMDDLDKLTNGLKPGDFWIMAARAGLGKTTFCLNVAYNVALKGIPVLYITLEMTKLQIFRKFLSLDSGVSFEHILRNELDSDEMLSVCKSISLLHDLPLYVQDDAGESIKNILDYASMMINKNNVRFIVIDYLQLIIGGSLFESRHAELSAVSRQIKSFALHYKTPVLGIAQLNRQIEARANKIPQLSDLKDSGSFEQDADVVLFLSRLREFEKDSVSNGEKNLTKIYVGKNRFGNEGMFKINFNGRNQRFTNYTASEPPP